MAEPAGMMVSINGKKVLLTEKVGEGGFATIFKAQDKAKNDFVAKKMTIRDNEMKVIVKNEFKVIKALNGHPNICKYEALEVKKEGEGFEAWALMENLSGGSLMDLLLKMKKEKTKFSEDEIWSLMIQVGRAVKYMHEQEPAICHRDLKPENILKNQKGKWKLIDFGSCVFGTVPLDTKEQCDDAERVIERTTTPLYRAPEITDFFGVEQLDEKVDIWALGCILYTACFLTNPFQKTGKLGIINGKYTVPKDNTYSSNVLDLIKGMLTADSSERLDIDGVLEIVEANARSKDKKDKKVKKDKKDIGGDFPEGKKKKKKADSDEDEPGSEEEKPKGAKKEKHHHKDKKSSKQAPPAPAAAGPIAPNLPASGGVEDLFGGFGATPAPKPAAPAAAANPFGGAANPFGGAPQQNPFGGAPQQNPFGGAPQQNPFGGAPQANPFGGAQANPFGGKPAQQQNPFGF